jgi:dimethylhistidine N-methyltransferase
MQSYKHASQVAIQYFLTTAVIPQKPVPFAPFANPTYSTVKLPLDISGLAAPPTPRSPQFIDLYNKDGDASQAAPADVNEELIAGLHATPACVSPKYFYNPLGSKLFEAITGLDEYYPTRTEGLIFEAANSQISAALLDAGIREPCLIDLGAGNCAKALALMPHITPRQYVPVDISVEFLKDAAGQVQNSFPALDIVGLGMDFSKGVHLPPQVQSHDRVFFYPGSSLGNFRPDQALTFLSHIADPEQGMARGLLLGIDLVKDTAVLEAAYDDVLGVTAAFNKNLLLNVNSILKSDFDLRQWQHVALFNTAESRIEMHLEASCKLAVEWPGHHRLFAKGERMLTEYSYKYTPASMTSLMREAGFREVRYWTDPKSWFAVFWATT